MTEIKAAEREFWERCCIAAMASLIENPKDFDLVTDNVSCAGKAFDIADEMVLERRKRLGHDKPISKEQEEAIRKKFEDKHTIKNPFL